MRRQTVKKKKRKIFENTDVEIDMKTGKGEIIFPLKHPSSVRL
jgi:hypothetical protein